MTARLPELRRDRRYYAALPVYLGNDMGATRDISTSGVYFWKDSMCLCYECLRCLPGESISFAIELETATGSMIWTCQGAVVRTEACGHLLGVAVTITESTIELPSTDVIRTSGVSVSC